MAEPRFFKITGVDDEQKAVTTTACTDKEVIEALMGQRDKLRERVNELEAP